MSRLARTAMVVGFALAAVLLPGSPVSAVIVTLPIASGTIRIGPVDVDLADSCVDPEIIADVEPTTFEVIDLAALVPLADVPGYIAEVSLYGGLSTPGDISGSSWATIGAVTPVDFAVQLDFYEEDNPCDPGALVCSAVYIGSHAGAYSGNPTATAATDAFLLEGFDISSGLQSLGSCFSPIAALISEPVEIIDLTATEPPTPVPGDIVGGAISIGGVSLGVPGACPSDTADVAISVVDAEITDLDARVHHTTSSGSYVVDISYLGSGPGDVDGIGPATVGFSSPTEFTIGLDFYQRAAACTPGVLVCSGAATIAASGIFSGDPANVTTDDELVLSGTDITSGLQPNPTCNAPLAGLLGEPVTITALTVALD